MAYKGKYVVAMDLGGTKLAGALVDQSGRIARRAIVSVDASTVMAPVRQMVAMARALAGTIETRNSKFVTPVKKKAGARASLRGKVVAVGVAVPGLVRRDGTVWAPNLRWKQLPLAQQLGVELGVPVVAESDRNAAVVGETWRGKARGKSDVIVLMIGTGIGAGILSGGRLLRGAHELSGCAGWMAVREEHREQARRVGQLESLASGPGIARAAQKELERGVESLLSVLPAEMRDASAVAEAARRGDMVSIEVFLEAGRLLGYGVANLVSLFDPEIVVIGGGLAKASDVYLDALRKSMKERAQPIAGRKVRLVVSGLGNDTNLFGAAKVAWEKVETF
jgi:glucokinase